MMKYRRLLIIITPNSEPKSPIQTKKVISFPSESWHVNVLMFWKGLLQAPIYKVQEVNLVHQDIGTKLELRSMMSPANPASCTLGSENTMGTMHFPIDRSTVYSPA